MKSAKILVLVGGILILAFSSLAYADVPQRINYQGKITTPGGALVDTTIQMVFSIYNSPTAVSAFWSETHPAVAVQKGIFSVVLGMMNPLDLDDFYWRDSVYLGVKVGADPEMTPRKQIVSTAYAITDGDWYEWENDLYRFEGSVYIGESYDKRSTGAGEVGYQQQPAKLNVVSDTVCAGYFASDYLDWNTHVIHAEVTGSGEYEDAKAVYGYSKPVDGYGIGGYFEGGYKGVYGYVSSVDPGDPVEAVYGRAIGGAMTTDNIGVSGWASYGVGNYGVYGEANGGDYDYGVYGWAQVEANSWAGYFQGNAMVTGTLTKGGGSFQIDHPLDPENKYLFHSFVESPDMKNVYDGVVTLDATGQATVQLPAYFEALNKDFRYQLTCIGGFAQVYIAQKISGNQFTIAGGEPGMEVSWQITGIRKDPFAEANRIQVEVDKPDNERGKYLHSEAYNLAEEYDIHYEQNKRMEEKREASKLD